MKEIRGYFAQNFYSWMLLMELKTPCPVCASKQAGHFIRHNQCDLVRCVSCGLVYMDPPPTPETLQELYGDAYHGATEGYFRKVPTKMRRSRHRVRRIVRTLGRDPRGLKFLDVGCNGGFLTEAAREAGFAATGLDPDGAAIAYARQHYPGNRFVHGYLEGSALEPGSFDAIYCSEVIEHSSDVNAFTARLSELMKPGGLIYLTTPDISHWRRPKDVTRWDAFCPPSHCLYFSPANLTELLRRHGLDVVWRPFSFKPGIKLMARKRG